MTNLYFCFKTTPYWNPESKRKSSFINQLYLELEPSLAKQSQTAAEMLFFDPFIILQMEKLTPGSFAIRTITLSDDQVTFWRALAKIDGRKWIIESIRAATYVASLR